MPGHNAAREIVRDHSLRGAFARSISRSLGLR
jgi:hypothetical protein